MKRFVSIIILLSLLLSFSACGSEHVHSFSEWKTQKEPTLTEGGSSIRKCSCGETETQPIPAKLIAFAEEIRKNADYYESGVYSATYNVKDFIESCHLPPDEFLYSYKDSVKNGEWSICPTFTSTSGTIAFLVIHTVDGATKSFGFSVEDGVILNNYSYVYIYTNYLAPATHKVYGTFNTKNLYSTSSFSYSNYSDTGKSISFFLDEHCKDACNFAQQLTIFFDAFFKYKNIPLNMTDFGFAQNPYKDTVLK